MEPAIDTMTQMMMTIACVARPLLDRDRGADARLGKLSIVAVLRSKEAESASAAESDEIGMAVELVGYSPQTRSAVRWMRSIGSRFGVGNFMLRFSLTRFRLPILVVLSLRAGADVLL